MSWKFDNSFPIYLQIIERIKLLIASEKWKPGEKIDPVRELAFQIGVNPNTVQRALSELEREGLIYSVRTSGRFVTENTALIKKTREKIAEEKIRDFFEFLFDLGYSSEDIDSILSAKINEFKRGE
jgi:DNA-binding transcriptional regulator YhcF (GntR family)